MPSNTPLPAAEFFSLWDDIARAIELDEMDWARSNVKRYRAARASSPRTLEEALMVEEYKLETASWTVPNGENYGERKLAARALYDKARSDRFEHARRLAGEGGVPCHEPQPDPTPPGKDETVEICWHTPIRQNPFIGALDMKSECGHTITADEEDKRFVPPTTCLRCGKPRRFKL